MRYTWCFIPSNISDFVVEPVIPQYEITVNSYSSVAFIENEEANVDVEGWLVNSFY